MIIYCWALLRRWWHCSWLLHRRADLTFCGCVRLIGCDCGHVFWSATVEERTRFAVLLRQMAAGRKGT